MVKRILIEERNGVTRTAVMEDDRLCQIFIDREENGSTVGRIILGTVQNILPSRFAFIDVGMEKNAFMNIPTGLHLKRGQPVLVQIYKDAGGFKGAYAGTELHFNGRLVILHEDAKGEIGISHKITEKRERERLRKIVRKAMPKGIGAIVRTNCEGKSAEEITAEILRLHGVLTSAMERARYAMPPTVIHKENLLLNDLLSDDLTEIWVDGSFEDVRRTVEISAPDFHNIFEHDAETEGRGLFAAFNLPHQIEKALRKIVRLPCGGFITIEQTEACVVVDVNTGQFIGKKNYRETILQTNMEAANILVEQIILRNLSGIIIVDFIDMTAQEDRAALIQAMEAAVKKDRLKTEVIGITELGLMQLTRRKTREPLSRILEKICPDCGGTGHVPL